MPLGYTSMVSDPAGASNSGTRSDCVVMLLFQKLLNRIGDAWYGVPQFVVFGNQRSVKILCKGTYWTSSPVMLNFSVITKAALRLLPDCACSMKYAV